MSKFTFDDEEQEPTFSLYDFKKWLSKQNIEDDPKLESVEKPEIIEKEEFKSKLRKRRKKKSD